MGLKRYFLPLALAASIPGDTPQEPYTPMPTITVGASKHAFTGNFEAMYALRPLAATMTGLARGDVMVLDADHFQNIRSDTWRELAPVKGALPLLSDRLVAFKEMQDVVKFASQNANAFTTRLRTADDKESDVCTIIIGTEDKYKADFISALTNLPEKIVQQYLMDQFDWNSLRTFILLHEASHCDQDSEGGDLMMTVLSKEIDADNKAIAAYQRLAVESPELNLDPKLPEKMRHVRALGGLAAPPLSEDPVYSILMHYYHTHTTAQGLHNNRAEGEEELTDTSRVFDVNAYTKSAAALLTYHSSDPRYIGEVETAWVQILREYPWSDEYTQMQEMIAALPIGAQIGSMQQMANPALSYLSMRYLAEEGLCSAGPEADDGDLRDAENGAKSFVRAWKYLGLPKLDDEYAEFRAVIHHRFGVIPGSQDSNKVFVELLLLDYHDMPDFSASDPQPNQRNLAP
jgi:hypothetical protein